MKDFIIHNLKKFMYLDRGLSKKEAEKLIDAIINYK